MFYMNNKKTVQCQINHEVEKDLFKSLLHFTAKSVVTQTLPYVTIPTGKVSISAANFRPR